MHLTGSRHIVVNVGLDQAPGEGLTQQGASNELHHVGGVCSVRWRYFLLIFFPFFSYFFSGRVGPKQAGKQASKQRSKQARKETRKEASERASKQRSKQA